MSSLVVHEIQSAELALRDLVARHEGLELINAELRGLTGIEAFLEDADLEKVRGFRTLLEASLAPRTIREWGDFQTPPTLATQVCEFLKAQGVAPATIIEPTYGLGHFLSAALESFPYARLFYGVEIQACYQWHFKMSVLQRALGGQRQPRPIHLYHDSIFSHTFLPEVLGSDEILILGNPPWVTSAELGALDSGNLPAKFNRDNLLGLSAMTGKSNFDLNESILLRLMETFGARCGTLALLCKNSVIKNWVERLPRLFTNVQDVQALEIDAQKEFGASVSASLLFARFGGTKRTFCCRAATLQNPGKTLRWFGWQGDKFVSDLDSYARHAALDGLCPLVWRQGIKHDCASVMEVSKHENTWINGLGEAVEIEAEHLFPLLKSSDLRGGIAGAPRKGVVISQQTLGQDTSGLQRTAPQLWDYLIAHRDALSARKSSIYRGKPQFSIFGVGRYSFAPFKVGVSGLYKTARFTLIEPIDGQPIVLDDTCYFLGFDEREKARLVTFLLSSAPAVELLQSLVFSDAKRPYTKELLMRLDLEAIRGHLQAQDFVEFWKSHGVEVDARSFVLPLREEVSAMQLCLL